MSPQFCRTSVPSSGFIRLVAGKGIFDWTSGLWVYRRSLRKYVMPYVCCDKWDFQFESLYKTMRRGHRVCGVPITFYEKAGGKASSVSMRASCF